MINFHEVDLFNQVDTAEMVHLWHTHKHTHADENESWRNLLTRGFYTKTPEMLNLLILMCIFTQLLWIQLDDQHVYICLYHIHS